MIKISMTLIVKNEEDIIEDNIKFHSSLGVDNFVILDNGSTDNTYSILNELKKRYEIHLLRFEGKFIQKHLTTKITKLANKLYKPHWIINNDADEFWMPKKHSNLKEALKIKGSVLQVPRYNMLIYEGLDNWKNSVYKVVNPIDYKIKPTPNKLLGKLVRKVIINPKGYIKTNSGNHSAEHFIFWQKKEYRDIEVYHYPIRSYKQFLQNVEVRVKAYKSGVPMGGHILHWIKAYEEGRLEEEWRKHYFSKQEIECFKKFQIVSIDETMKNKFQTI